MEGGRELEQRDGWLQNPNQPTIITAPIIVGTVNLLKEKHLHLIVVFAPSVSKVKCYLINSPSACLQTGNFFVSVNGNLPLQSI